MAEVTDRLIQQLSSGEEKQFLITDNRTLNVLIKRAKRGPLKYQIDLLALNSKSKLHSNAKWLHLGLAVIALLGSGTVAAYLFSNNISDSTLYGAVSISVGLVIGTFFIIPFSKSLRRKHLFFSRHADIPLVEVEVALPNKKFCDNFVSRLELLIDQLQSSLELPEDKQIAGEMRTLRRLCEQGVVAQKAYNQTKEKLLKKF